MNALTTDSLNQSSSRTFNEVLFESVDETLTDLVGDRTKSIILDYFEKRCSLPHSDIPSKPNTYFTLLVELSGKAGVVIGRATVRKLYSKLGWEFKEIQGFNAIDYLEAAKIRYNQKLIQPSGTA